MRRVKIKHLRSDLSNQLQQLPFIITKHGNDIAIVRKATAIDHTIEAAGEVEKARKLKVCKHGLDPQLCKDSECRKKR